MKLSAGERDELRSYLAKTVDEWTLVHMAAHVDKLPDDQVHVATIAIDIPNLVRCIEEALK